MKIGWCQGCKLRVCGKADESSGEIKCLMDGSVLINVIDLNEVLNNNEILEQENKDLLMENETLKKELKDLTGKTKGLIFEITKIQEKTRKNERKIDEMKEMMEGMSWFWAIKKMLFESLRRLKKQ